MVPFTLFFVPADAKAYEPQKFDRYSKPDFTTVRLEGRGGTDFSPAFNMVAHYRANRWCNKPAALVYVTDGVGGFPEKIPDYPVIWVSTQEASDYPFGAVIQVPPS